MVRCNLAVLLAERNLRITKVSSDTGISRTTLTNLANNYGTGIQLDTLNTLCMYLKVTPSQIFHFVPVDIKVKAASWDDDSSIEILLDIKDHSGTHSCSLGGTAQICTEGYDIVGVNVSVSLYDEEVNGEVVRLENQIIRQSFARLTIPFYKDVENQITHEVIDAIDQYYLSRITGEENNEGYGSRIVDGIAVSFQWDADLQPKL